MPLVTMTDSQLAITAAIRRHLAQHPDDVDPRSYLKPARAAMQAVIEQRMRAFRQAGHAGDYPPLTVEQMQHRYAAAS